DVLRGARPDAGDAPGERCGYAVPLGDLLHDRRAASRRRDGAGRVQPRARGGGEEADHDGNRAGRAVLLRGGLSPAVPAQGAERLLRAERDGCDMPDTSGVTSNEKLKDLPATDEEWRQKLSPEAYDGLRDRGGQRYCMNSVALELEPEPEQTG